MTETKTQLTSVTARLAARTTKGLSKEAQDDLDFLAETLAEVGRANDTLRSAASRVAERAQRISYLIDEGLTVNSLGEIQGAALSVDLACAVRSTAIESYVRTRHYIVRSGALHEDAVVKFETEAGWRA